MVDVMTWPTMAQAMRHQLQVIELQGFEAPFEDLFVLSKRESKKT